MVLRVVKHWPGLPIGVVGSREGGSGLKQGAQDHGAAHHQTPFLIPRFSPRCSAQGAHLVLSSRKTHSLGEQQLAKLGASGADDVVSSSTCLRLEKDLWQSQTSLGTFLGLLVVLEQQVCSAPGLKWVSRGCVCIIRQQ